MAEQLQLRRGTTAEHAVFTGAVGEATVDTDKDVIVVHDGTTVGGFPLAKQSDVALKAVDAEVVKLTGDQSVAGIKTFTSIPVVPATSPTTDNQVTRKKYVDDGLALKTGIGTTTPLAPAVTAVVGTSTNAARQDHVHPTNFTATATDIKMNGTQAVGSLVTFARADHVHPSDTSKADLALINWRDTMMSKAEFNAVAAERRANRAGSGFDEFGRGFTNNVNEGINIEYSLANTFFIGRRLVDGVGTSKTPQPYVNINGIISRVYSASDSAGERSAITLPPAPTVLPSTATLTQQQIDSGVIKHADASNSGLILNGKFDTDTSSWSTDQSSVLTIDTNRLKITNGATLYGKAYQLIPTIVGKEYIFESDFPIGNARLQILNHTTSASLIGGDVNPLTGRYSLKFVATSSVTKVQVYVASNVVDAFTYIDNIAVFPADAISRSDLCLLESWHEDISEKDFVYPLGNVQYLGTTGDAGTTVAGAFAGSATYSLFSDTWQADSALVGKGYVWSTLSDANKKAFVANPENNCYLDGDKVIQVRYRMRVQLGEDTWTMAKATVQGKAVTASTTLFTAPVTTVDAGLYSNTSTTYTYTGTTTSAIEVCRVSR